MCLCDCVVNHESLQSFTSNMPRESSRGSSSSNLAVHGAPNPKHEKDLGFETDFPSIIRSVRVLVEGMLPHVSNPKDSVAEKKSH